MPARAPVPLALLAATVSLALGACGGEPAAPEAQRASGLPEGWGGGASPSYSIGTDYTNRHGGAAAAYLTSLSQAPSSFATVHQLIRADDYRGRRVRWSGWVRSSKVGGQGGGLWMRIDAPGVVPGFDNMLGTRPILGSHDWSLVSVVLDVPDEAIGVAAGALLSGPGDLLVDDFRFEVVGSDVSTTNELTQPVAGPDSATLADAYAAAPNAPRNLDFEASQAPATRVMAVTGAPSRIATSYPPRSR